MFYTAACYSALEDMADVTNFCGAAPPASAAAAAAAVKPSTSKKSLKPRKTVQAAKHPKYREMIASAIALKEWEGWYRQVKLRHFLVRYWVSCEINKINARMMVLRADIQSGSLQQTKGTGASGSFSWETVESAKPQPAKAAGKPGPFKKAKATAVAKKVAVTAKKLKSATPKKLKGKSHKKGALAEKPEAKSPAKKWAKPKKVVKKTPTKKQSSSKLAKK